MSTTTIHFELRIGAILTNATSVVLSDPTGAFGVRRVDTGAVVVADGTAIPNIGIGIYDYTFTDPASGLTYNYWVEFVYAGNTYRIEQDISGGTGGGVSTVVPAALPSSCVSLPRFAEILEIDECLFWGVSGNASSSLEPCDHVWTEKERNRVARYLAEAQQEIETLTRYPLCPTWFINEQHPYTWPIHTDWGKVIAAGFRHEVDILAGAAVNYVTDPATVTAPTTVTDENEVHVYYAGSTREIIPESVTISGGNVVIEIPWCRLVKPNLFTTSPIDYNTATNFVSSVDVVRVYNDTSIEAGLVWPHLSAGSCLCGCCEACATCGEYTETACIYVRNPELGTLDILPATYSAGGWTSALCTSCYCKDPSWVRVNYQAGLPEITLDFEEAVIQLAMAKMPYSPCACDGMKEYWAAANEKQDRMYYAFGLNKVGAYRALDTVNKKSQKMGFAIG